MVSLLFGRYSSIILYNASYEPISYGWIYVYESLPGCWYNLLMYTVDLLDRLVTIINRERLLKVGVGQDYPDGLIIFIVDLHLDIPDSLQ